MNMQNATNGVFGLGPLSPFWYSLVDPDTNQATYSFSIARQASPQELQQLSSSSASSNITLGGISDDDVIQYYGASNTTISARSGNQISYNLGDFSFGEVYQSNGTITSAYYESLTGSTTYTALFNLAEYGLALPQTLFDNYIDLLQFVTSNSTSCAD